MRVHIEAPEIQTLLFSVSFLILLLLSLKKASKTSFFDINITNEIKGFAILAIIFSHIGYFLVDSDKFLFPLSVLAGVGVNIFLFISGYGLAASAIQKPLSILDFYKRRIIKLFLPLWLSLVFVLTLDKIFLSRVYPWTETWQAFLGFFPTADLTSSINSPLWFITLIIIYYLLFPLIFFKRSPFTSGLVLLTLSFIFFNSKFIAQQTILSTDVFHLYKLHFAAFPLGIMAADVIHLNQYAKTAWFHFKNFARRFYLLGIIFTLAIFSYTAFNSGVGESPFKEQFLSLVTTLALVLLFIFKRVSFRLLTIFGLYSYEIYLLHWPILSRYNFLYQFLPPFIATLIYLGLLLLLGYLLQFLTVLILKWYSKLRWHN